MRSTRLSEENRALQTNIRQLTGINDDIAQQLEDKLHENEQLQKDLSNRSTLVSSYSDYCDDLITDVTELNQKNNELVQRVQQQVSQNKDLLNHIARQDEHIEQLENEIVQLKDQLSQNLNPFLNPIVDKEMQRLQRQVTELQQRNRHLEAAPLRSRRYDDDNFDVHDLDDHHQIHHDDEFDTDDEYGTDNDNNNHNNNTRVLNRNETKRVNARSRPFQENNPFQRRSNTTANSDLDRNSLFNSRSNNAGKRARFSHPNDFEYRLMDRTVFQQAIEDRNITSRMDANTHDINHNIQPNQVLVGTKEYVNGQGDVEGTACLAVHHDGLIEDWSHGDALDDDEIALEMAMLVIEKYKKGDSVDIGGTDSAQIQRVTTAIHHLKNELLDYQLIYDEDNMLNPEPNCYVLSAEGLMFYDHLGEANNIFINADEVGLLRDIFNQGTRKADFNDLKRITAIINFSVPYQDVCDIRTNPAPANSQQPHLNTQNIHDYKEKLLNLKASAEAVSTENARFNPNGQ